jgi:hypothetical protein
MRLGTRQNEYGTLVSVHRCDVCGDEFTLCPAIDGDDTCGFPGNEERPACGSYDPGRDVGLLFEAGAVGRVDPDGAVVIEIPPKQVS